MFLQSTNLICPPTYAVPKRNYLITLILITAKAISWEQRKLEDFIIEYHEVTTKNNQYPALTSSRKGIFLQTEYFAGNQIASEDNTGYNIVPYGYFTYRHMSDDEIFHFNINDIVENGIVSTLYPVFTTNENLDSRYLQYQLNHGHEFAKFAVLQKQGGSRTYMYLSKLKQLSLTMPKNVEEQKKISGFFMELDNLITLHQRKYDKLKNIKKSMLEKMFPKNGETKPEIRFDGFTDDWEQRKFSDVVDIGSGMDYKHLGEGDIPVYGTGGYMLSVDAALSEDKDAIGIGRKGTIDKPYILRAPFWTVDTLFYCIPKDGYDLDFTCCLFQNVDWKKKDESTGVPSLSKVIINNVETAAPSYDEQRRIGDYFKGIDNLITLHQRKPLL